MNPRVVVAGHKNPANGDDPHHIEATRTYIRDFNRLKAPMYVRALSPEEQAGLEAGLRSSDAFTLRCSQILLASRQVLFLPGNSLRIRQQCCFW
jgi:hypothetical protein